MADRGPSRPEDDTVGDDFERVSSDLPHVDVTPQSVHVTTNNTYARAYYNIEAQHVQVFTSGQPESGQTTPLSFNALHGRGLVLENVNSKARRTKGYKNGICFANRHFSKDSAIHFKITDTFEGTYGRCRMGFTNRDPTTLTGSGILQKGMECAKSSEGFMVFEPSMDTCAYPGAVIYFSYLNGTVTFRSSKDGAIQRFPCPDVFQANDTLWAFIETRGPVTAAEAENNTFHDVCGSLACVQENRASQGWWYTFGSHGGLVCFTHTPIPQGRHAEFKLSGVHMNSAGHMRVGVCKENPDLIRPEHLPSTGRGHPQFITMEISAEDAACGNIISLIPDYTRICVLVNNKKHIGVINLEKNIHKTWAVVELFGKTNAVEILTHFPGSEPQVVSTSQKHIERELDPAIGQQMSSVSTLWLESQDLMNTLKVMADTVLYHLEGAHAGAQWNSLVSTVATAASYIGLASYLQMAEIGDGPDVLRSEGPTLAASITQFVSHIDSVKISAGQMDSSTISSRQTEQFKLLRSIAAALPQFEVQMPTRHSSTPPPTPLLLNLSPLPQDTDNLQSWYKPVIYKTLLETANKIEAAFVPLDNLIRKVYIHGI